MQTIEQKETYPKIIDPLYKKGQPVSLRVYTPAMESFYILFKNVPRLTLVNELKTKLEDEFGEVEEAYFMDDADIFTMDDIQNGYHEQDCIVIKFKDLMNALLCKKKLDEESFYGRLLHLEYCPDLESVEDTKRKIEFRVNRVQN